MNDYVTTIKLHFVDRLTMIALPWGITILVFLVNYAIFAIVPSEDVSSSGGVATLPCYMAALGTLALTRSMPFGMMLGVTRRRFYLGSIAVAVIVSVLGAVGITALNLIEGATGGWGIDLHFFRVNYLLDGSWYQVLVTSAAIMALFFIGGMWLGLIFRAWGMVGIGVLIGALGVIALGVSWLVTLVDGWQRLGDALSDLTVAGSTSLCAAAAVLLAAVGYLTIRRATV